MFKKIGGLIGISLIAIPAYAWVCPNNFNPINPGDSLATVINQCGKPLIQKASEGESNGPQEWGFYVAVNPPNPNTIKLTVVFANQKVISLVANAMSLTSTSMCGGTINVGDSMETVKAACGNPMFINKGQQSASQKPSEILELIYPGEPETTLVFVNGLLKERR